MKKASLSIFTLILLGSVACQPEAPLPAGAYQCTVPNPSGMDDHPRQLQFQAVLDEATSASIPGAVAYLRTADGADWLGASGFASLKDEAPMEPCHRMMIASVSKVFIATAIFQLIEAGEIDLNASLGTYLEGEYMERIEHAKVVTIRQMLNHTSGLYDYLWPTKFELWSIQHPNHSATVEEKLSLAYGKSPTHEPGETYSYSNTNFVLLGMLVEEVSGLPLDDYLSQRVFGPLGLESAFMGTVEQPIPGGVPEGYFALQGGENLQPSAFYYSNDLATGDGGVAIRMDELATFYEAVFVGDLLAADTKATMQEAFTLPVDWQGDYHTRNAQGIEIYETPYGTAYGHTGSIVGFLTTAWYFPDTGAVLNVSINGVSPATLEARQQLVDELLAAVFE